MGAEVYFAQRRATQGGGLLEKVERIFAAAGLGGLFHEGDRVAIKAQIGERGNSTHLRPDLIRRVVKRARHHGGRPFVTDTGSEGARVDAVGHLILAAEHGFDLAALGAPFLVADGLDGRDSIPLAAQGSRLGQAPIAAGLARADAIVAVSHVTSDPLFGFCGALHNLGLLGVARAERHQLTHRSALAVAPPSWSVLPEPEEQVASSEAQEAMVEAFAALAHAKPGRLGFINVLLDITPDPDSHAWSDAPIVPDIGILASRDPVALDQASADFVNGQTGIAGTRLSDPACSDKLRALHPDVDWSWGLAYAERLGLGTRAYELLII